MTRMTGPDCVVMCNLINTYLCNLINIQSTRGNTVEVAFLTIFKDYYAEPSVLEL